MPIFAFAFEQLMQLKYGIGGGAAAVLLLFGLRNKSEMWQYCALIAVLLALY